MSITRADLTDLAKTHRLVPITRTLFADAETPVGVYRKLAEKEVLQHEPVTKELVDGEGFLYLGRSHRLKIDDADGAVRLERGRLILPRPLTEAGEANLIAWYRRCGEG